MNELITILLVVLLLIVVFGTFWVLTEIRLRETRGKSL